MSSEKSSLSMLCISPQEEISNRGKHEIKMIGLK